MNIRTTLATLVAAGGVVGTAGTAAASTTVTYNIGPETSPAAAVNILGQTEFYYGEQVGDKSTFLFTAAAGNGLGSLSSTYSFPGAGETYGNTEVQTAYKGDPLKDGAAYLHLTFLNGGVQYVGTASFNKDAYLKSITYDTLASVGGAVPEPASWALLIAGFGVAGASLRQRRRQAVAA